MNYQITWIGKGNFQLTSTYKNMNDEAIKNLINSKAAKGIIAKRVSKVAVQNVK